MEKKLLNKAPSFIWDLDGTLIDSYEVIVSSLYETCREFGMEMEKEEIHREVITTSVRDFLALVKERLGERFEAFLARYTAAKDGRVLEIRPIAGAAETLGFLKANGSANYVYTHRGRSTETVLKNTGLYEYFDEIVNAENGFPRKPAPDAVNYLIEKYRLDRKDTYYVGDRTLDVECAVHAGVGSILYLPAESPAKPEGKESLIVRDLREICRMASDIDQGEL